MELSIRAKIILEKVQEYHELILKKCMRPLKWTNGDQERLEELTEYCNWLEVSNEKD